MGNKLSIITINRNNVIGLRKTIESVLCQTFSDLEFIIIDGASTDGSMVPFSSPEGGKLCEVLSIENGYHSCNWFTRLGNIAGGFISEEDSGIYNAMNKGILKAKGEYCLFLNSGDWLYNENVLKDVFDIKFDEDIVYGGVVSYDAKGITKKIEFPDEQFINYEWFINGSLPHNSTFIKRELFFKIQLYSENFKIISDWEFFIVAICKYNCSLRKLPLFVNYFDTTGISSLEDNKKLIKAEGKIAMNNNFPRIHSAFSDLIIQKKEFEKYRSSFLYKLQRRIHKLLSIK